MIYFILSSPTEFSWENRSQPPTLTGEALWPAGVGARTTLRCPSKPRPEQLRSSCYPRKWVTRTALLPAGGRDEVGQGRRCRQGQRRQGRWEGVRSCDHPETREEAVECPGLWLYPCYALGNKGGSHCESLGILGDLPTEIIESPGVLKTLIERDWTVWSEDTHTHVLERRV